MSAAADPAPKTRAFTDIFIRRPVLATVVKSPPSSTFPSGCTVTANTFEFAPVPGLKLESTRPCGV